MPVRSSIDDAGRRTYQVTGGAERGIGGGVYGSSYASGVSSGRNGSTQASQIVMSGGTMFGATALDGGVIAAANHAVISGGTAGSNASVDAMNGGTNFDVTVSSGGALAAAVAVSSGGTRPLGGFSAGGTAYNPHVLSGGFTLTGGGGAGFQVKGYFIQGSGGLISGGTYEAGAMSILGFGGTTMGGTYGGLQYVLSTGSAVNNLFTGSAGTQLINGGIASRSTVISGATASVSGGQGAALTAMRGGTVMVQGGTYQSVVQSGIGTPVIGDYSSSVSVNDVLSSGGREIVGSDGTVSSSHILSGAQGTVLLGGTGLGIDVNGGREVISSGGLLSGGSASNRGVIQVLSGGMGSSLVANSTASVMAIGGVDSSGATIPAQISGLTVRGGTGDVLSGATVTNYVVSGGQGLVHSGDVSGFTVSAGTGAVSQGGTVANGFNVSGGTGVINSGAQVDSFNIGPGGGTGILSAGGTVSNAMSAAGSGIGIVGPGASAASVVASGTFAGGSSYQGGTILLSGTASGASAMDGGVLSATNGAVVSSALLSGGTGYVYQGATFPDDVSVTGGSDSLGTFGGALFAENGADLDTVNVSQGGSGIVDNGGFVSTFLGGAGGTINVNGGGSVQSALLNGANGTVQSGGTIDNLTGTGGGTSIVSGAGVVSQMVLSSGIGTLQSGATVRRLQILNGGSGVLMSGASVLSILVSSGGWISGANVSAGNSMSVVSGGTALNTIVTDSASDSTKGRVYVSSGGSLINATISSASATRGLGGLLTIESGANLQNTSVGYNGRIRILGLKYDGFGTTFVQGGTLHVVEKGTQWTTSLRGNYPDAGDSSDGFQLLDDGQGNTVVVYDKCFLPGTMIRLAHGEVPVEQVQRGDKISVWVDGRTEVRDVVSVMKRRAQVHKELPDDMAGWSVKIVKDAFEPGVPSQDLSVTPEHCFYFDGKFVPARMLVNGQTIYYDRALESYDFYHVETQPHAIIWANNTLTESYLDTGERRGLMPSDDDEARLVKLDELTWNDHAAAPLAVDRGFVEPLYHRLAPRSGQVVTGYAGHVSDDADLRLMLDDGTVIRKLRQKGDQAIFSIPGSARSVRLVSRRFRPSEMIGPFVDDRRTLGVLVGKVTLWAGSQETELTDYRERSDLAGWDVREAGPHRWTRGDAVLELPESIGQGSETRVLAIQVQAGGPYKVSLAKAAE